MAVPSLVASSLTSIAIAPPAPNAQSLSASTASRAQPQTASLPQSALASGTGLTAHCTLREHSAQEKVDLQKTPLPQALHQEAQVYIGNSLHSPAGEKSSASEAGKSCETIEVVASNPAALEAAAARASDTCSQGVLWVEGSGLEEGPAVKRKKSIDLEDASRAEASAMAVKTEDSHALGATPVASAVQEAVDSALAGAVTTPDKTGEGISGQQRHQKSTQEELPEEQQKGQQAQAASPQGTIAALRGYLFSTTERIASAVGGFGSRQSASPPTLEHMTTRGQADPSSSPVAPPGGTPRPSRPGLLFGRTPRGAAYATVAQGASSHAQGPGAWWNDDSDEVAAAAATTTATTTAAAAAAEVPTSTGMRAPGEARAGERQEGGEAGAGGGGGDKGEEAGVNESGEWVNTALIRWEKRRAAWRAGERATGNDGPAPREALAEEELGRQSRRARQEKRENETRRPKIRPGTVYEDLLSSSRPFAEPIPLPEMVEFLVDCWREEGLYD